MVRWTSLRWLDRVFSLRIDYVAINRTKQDQVRSTRGVMLYVVYISRYVLPNRERFLRVPSLKQGYFLPFVWHCVRSLILR